MKLKHALYPLLLVAISANIASASSWPTGTGDDEFWYELKDDEGRTNAAKVIV